MLRNSVDLDELKNRQTFPKNNYFCYKWRIKDHFNRSIERQQYHLNSLGANNDKSLMNDRIMQLYKSSFGTSRKDLIVDLAQEAMSFLEKRRSDKKRAEHTEQVLCQATTRMVDYASNILLGFSTELNSLMGLSELFITAAEPESKKLGAGTDGGITHVVQSSFSTHTFRLAIEGRLEVINFYLVPADTMLTLNEIARHYEPLERWRSTIEANGEVKWHNEEGIVTKEMAEVICANLLRYLIAATQERLAPTEQKDNADEFFFEMSAPAPWEVDMAGRGQSISQNPSTTASRDEKNVSGDNNDEPIYPELPEPLRVAPEIVAAPEQFPETHPHYFVDDSADFPAPAVGPQQFANTKHNYDIGSKSLYDLPCVTQEMIAAVSQKHDLLGGQVATPARVIVDLPTSISAPLTATLQADNASSVAPQPTKTKKSKAKSRGKRRKNK